MIAEEELDNVIAIQSNTSIKKGSTLNSIIRVMIQTAPNFLLAASNPTIIKPLNENKLTQIFVEQVASQLLKYNYPFSVLNQYSDLFFDTKGIPDFYFYIPEEGKTNKPLFIVEAKRLPAPSKEREKEYVVGNKSNGGIERFKKQIQGKGLAQLGLLAFVESNDYSHWLNTINNWIINLSSEKDDWHDSETLTQSPKSNDCYYLTSIAHAQSSMLDLHHIWIKMS